jgi:hypothetical protein
MTMPQMNPPSPLQNTQDPALELLWPQMIAAARNFPAVQGTKSRLAHNATSIGNG